MSFFYNAVSFISSFFTKQAESDFDDLYLNQDDPIGNLAPLVPSKVEPATSEANITINAINAEAPPAEPAGPPAEPPGVFLVVVPPEEPSGVVLVEIPPAELPAAAAELPAVTLDLLKLKQNSTTPPKESNPDDEAEVINYADATKPYVLPPWVTKSKSSITTTKRKYYEDISEIEFCVEIVDDYDSEASYDYTLETNINNDDGIKIKLGFINLSNFKVKIVPNKFVNYVGTNLLIPVNITEKTINIISGTNGVDTNDVLVQRVDNENKDLDDDPVPVNVNIVEKMVQAVQQLNKCINNQNTLEQINEDNFETLFFGQTPHDISQIIPTTTRTSTSTDDDAYQSYFTANMKSKSNNNISQKLTLVMTYKKLYFNIDTLTLADYNNEYDEYTISFSYAITAEKTQKKTLMTQTMVDFIALKLTNGAYNNRVKDLFDLPIVLPDIKYVLLEPENATPNDRTTLQIYTPNELNSLVWNEFTAKLAQLNAKPRTLLTHDSLNTYLNILIAMLDKPHDIIGGRVSEEAQKNVLKIISDNIEEYIKYLRVIITNSITKINGNNFNTDNHKKDKIDKFIDFIKFVKSMIPKFRQSNPSKYINTDVIYENAIMLSVQQILKEDPGVTSGMFDAVLNAKFPPPPAVMGNDNVVINPDVMYLTTEITSRVNQPGTTYRKYFSAPEVIDHGHIYNIDDNTNIQFPENYKQIQLRDPWPITHPTNNYFTIHSYSETTNELQLDTVTGTNTNTLYYNVYVWFTENDVTTPKGIIKYKTPFIYAPDCARVYAGYKNLYFEDIKPAFNAIAENFTNLSVNMRNLIPYLIIDQFYNAKSLQDDQNQLQVNQRTTIPPIPPIPPDNMPTQFLGLCCDLTSAANGFNYYMSQQDAVRNINSIVGYYHSNKKIWVTNRNEIKFQITNTPAKTASKNILDILKAMINTLPPLGGTVVGGDVPPGFKRSRAELESRDWQPEISRENVQPEFKRKKLTLPNNKRKQENVEDTRQVEGRGVIENLNPKDEAKKEANAITLSYYCDETKWADDDTKTEEYGQYVYYNTMADWLYLDNNFEKYKTFLFKQVKYVMTRTKYDVIGTEYLSSNCFFDILSIDFIEKMIKMLSRSEPLIDIMIKRQRNNIKKISNTILDTIIGQCAIYILTKIELKPDNIYTPNEQIEMSNNLDEQFFDVKNVLTQLINEKLNQILTNKKSDNKIQQSKLMGGNQPKGQSKFENTDESESEDEADEDLGGGFSKKRIFRKNTNKKRTIRKKTNKKRTIRKKIRHTIFKTKKNHK